MTCVERALYRAHDVLTIRMFAGGLGPVGRAALVAVRCALDKVHAERVAALADERAAHALTRARLEAAERVVEAAQRVLVQPEHWEERVRQALATIITWTR